MVFRLSTRAFLVLASTALAGCSGNGGDADGTGDDYPDRYMLATYGVPEGFRLLDEDDEGWEMTADYGLESNPGWADPETMQGESEDENATPIPERVYVAIYARGQPETEYDYPDLLISMAAEMASDADADATETDGHICEDPEEGFPGFFLRKGRIFAIVVALSEDVEAEIEDASEGMQAATGAKDVCP